MHALTICEMCNTFSTYFFKIIIINFSVEVIRHVELNEVKARILDQMFDVAQRLKNKRLQEPFKINYDLNTNFINNKKDYSLAVLN